MAKKIFEALYRLTTNTMSTIDAYFNYDKLASTKYDGNDAELLKVVTSKKFAYGFEVYLNPEKIDNFANFERKGDTIVINGLKERTTIQVEDIYSCNNNIHLKGSNGESFAEKQLTIIARILVFVNKYKYVLDKARNKVSAYLNVFGLNDEQVKKIVIFPFISGLKKENFDVLPEFFLSNEALEIILEKVKDEYLSWDVVYPYNEFVINIGGMKTLYKLSDDDLGLLYILNKNERGRFSFALSTIKTMDDVMAIYFFADYKSHEPIDGDLEETEASYIYGFINVAKLLLYYYFHYEVKVEVEEKTEKSAKNGARSYHRNSTVTTIQVPRRVVIHKSDAITSRKKRIPTYTANSWERSGHYRYYRDEYGNVVKKVYIKPTTCNRKAGGVFGATNKKALKVTSDGVIKSTKR